MWEQDLTAAFTLLLGRPVDGFEGGREYGLYYVNKVNPDGARQFFTALDGVGALRETRSLEVALSPDWRFDLGRSVFEIEFHEESALAWAFGARPESNLVAEAMRTVSGRELADTLAAHGLTPAEVAGSLGDEAVTAVIAFRVVTDGSLRGAMRTAIRGDRGPDGLRPDPEEGRAALFPDAVPPADGALDTIRDPRLRAHVWSPYLDQPWEPGGTAAGCPFVPGDPVGAWDLAYFGDISLTVTAAG